MKIFSFSRRILAVVLAVLVAFGGVPFPRYSLQNAYAASRTPTAQELHDMMGRLADPSVTEVDKKKITAVVFYHEDVYRREVLLGNMPEADANVKAFLEAKTQMHLDIAQRMNVKYKNKTGANLKAPIIPFSYNNILSDDDIILGSGKIGAEMEPLYNEALDDFMKEHINRPMSAGDRQRVDVNGLAWDMTQDDAFRNFKHHEKYINPQSGFANQSKLLEAKEPLVYAFDDNGKLVKLPPDKARDAIKTLTVERPLEIPGVNMEKGTGSISDFFRMADIHQVKFKQGKVTPEEVAQFIRNQKYTERVEGDYRAVAAADNPHLTGEFNEFLETSKKIRKEVTVKGVAKILQEQYKIPIIDEHGIINFDKLTEAMKAHQLKQLNDAMPKLMGAVMQDEAFKMVKWLREGGSKALLRKQLALTYAPISDERIKKIMQNFEVMGLAPDDKAFFKNILEKDTKQIRRYADLLEIPTEELTKHLKLEGANMAVVDIIETKNVKVRALTDALGKRSGGSKFRQFLRSRTAAALNLDTMLEGSPSEKAFSWGVLILACGRAYSASQNETEGLKAMGMALFETIPLISASLRFSEMEFRESFKELAMDIFPPLALAQLGFSTLGYVAQSGVDALVEGAWEKVLREAMRELGDQDFEKTESGYYRLKNRQAYLEYLEEVSPGMGKVVKLASLIEPEVDALMSRNPEVKNNDAALYTILWLEGVKVQPVDTPYNPQAAMTNWAMKEFAGAVNKWLTGLSIEQLKRRVYEEGLLARGQASNVERVASKIILDNLSIRAASYTQVLDRFIDRIEKRYNDLKGELKAGCSEGGILSRGMEIISGPADICDPSAIIAQTMAIIKRDYESAASVIQESPWGMEELKKGYGERVEYLTNYKVRSGITELELRQEMQQAIDDFREFIERLKLGVGFYKELQSLNLRAYVYGGAKSLEPTDTLMLGGQFRIGISAKASAGRANLRWAIYYYAVVSSSGGGQEPQMLKLLGSVSLKPAQFGSGTEGFWPIEEPEKATHLQINRDDAFAIFPEEGAYEIFPVFAYGDWKNDPLSEVGYGALINPIENVELFEKDRVAYAGEKLSFIVRRAGFSLSAPQFVYLNEKPRLSLVLEVPDYAREEALKTTFAVIPPDEGAKPELEPATLNSLSTDAQKPSQVKVIMGDDSKEGSYIVEAKVELQCLDKDSQPFSQSVRFDYARKENPEVAPDEEGGEQAGLEELLTRMQALEARAGAAAETAEGIQKTFNDELRDTLKTLDAQQKELNDIEAKIGKISKTSDSVDINMSVAKKASDEAYRAGEAAAAARGEIEQRALKGCAASEAIKNTSVVSELNRLIEEARGEQAAVNGAKANFDREHNNARSGSIAAEKIYQEYARAKSAREEIKANLAQRENAVKVLASDVERLHSHVSAAEEVIVELSGIKDEAAGVLDKAVDLAPARPQGDDKKILGQIKGLFGKIEKSQARVSKLAEGMKGKLASPKEKLEADKQKIAQLRAEFEAISGARLNDETIGGFKKISDDARASFDAADIFSDSVGMAAKNYASCLSAAESMYAKKTSPEAQVAQWDCSAYPGTMAKWDAAKKTPFCECAPGNLWDEQKYQCVPEEEYYMARIDCSAYSNSHPQWDRASRKALCYCDDGYEWNNARNNCRVASRIQVAQANCSGYPGTSAGWDSASESVQCYCAPGYYWDQGQNRCLQTYRPPQQQGGGQDLGQVLGGLVDIYNQGVSGGSGGAGTGTGGNPWSGSQQQQQQADPCENNFYFQGYAMVCGCDGYTFSARQNKCIPGAGGGSGATSAQSGGQNTQSGLSDVTVNRSPTQITVWDHGTEDLDTVNIYLNNQLVQGGLVLRNARQSLTLYLNPGNNVLTVEAVNEGDPEINRQRNLPRGNAAAIEISGVTGGSQSQSWTLYTGQSGTMKIYYQP
jgi:hypothetical protein